LNGQLDINDLVDHLFRHESGKMVAVLTRLFGSENLELAEDIVQDSIVEAIKNWTHKGVPDNPTAWLYRVAKNKALNILAREKYKLGYAAEISHALRSEQSVGDSLNHLFSDQQILDD